MVTTKQKPIVDSQKNLSTLLQKIIKSQMKRAREGTKEIQNSQKTINKMATSMYISIITLNVNGPNSPIKRHRLAEWKKKYLYATCKRLTSDVRTHAD